MKQIIVNLDAPEIIALEKAGDKRAIAKVNKCLVFTFPLFENTNNANVYEKPELYIKKIDVYTPYICN